MNKKECFIFNPKQWLGDAAILEMDWDVRGMHIHLLCLASQQENPGELIYNESTILKVLNIQKEDWESRVRKQLLKAWKMEFKEDLFENYYLIKQNGFIKTYVEAKTLERKKQIDNKNKNKVDIKDPVAIIEQAQKKNETISNEEKDTIWKIGVNLITKQTNNESRARTFLAKIIKEYSPKEVAQAIAQLSLQNNPPVEIQSYLVGVLKSGNKPKTRGKVSL